MPRRRRRLAAALLIVLASCGPDPVAVPGSGPAPAPRPRPRLRAGVTEEAGGDLRAAVRGSFYVPVYPYVYADEGAPPLNLAVTLHVRNADRSAPVVIDAVRYFGASGTLVRSELTTPLRLAPLAATEFFVKESDSSDGPSTSFLVDWSAAAPVTPPVVEAVMLGTRMNQGIAFTSPGRAVAVSPAGPSSPAPPPGARP